MAYKILNDISASSHKKTQKEKVEKKTKMQELEEKYDNINKELTEIKKLLNDLISRSSDDGK